MRKVAGVLLIIAACLNLFASVGYLLGGALTAGVSMGVNSLGTELAGELASQQGQALSPEFADGMDRVADVGMAAGGALVVFGAFLLVAFAVLIAGAVFLFKGARPKFIFAAGVTAMVAEVGGVYLAQFGITNLVGLVGGALALLCARQLLAASPPADEVGEALAAPDGKAREALGADSGGVAGIPVLGAGSMALADGAAAAFDATDKQLMAVMIVGMLMMVGASLWYFLG